MRRLLPLLLFFGFAFSGIIRGQSIAWEKRMGWRGIDALADVVAIGDSTFLACGLRNAYGHAYGVNSYWYSDVALVKIKSNGDTSWIRSVGMDGQEPHICLGQGNTIYVALTAPWMPNQDLLTVLQLDFDGNVLNRWAIPGTADEPICRKLIQSQDGTLVLVGNRPPPVGMSGLSDMFVIRMEPTQGLIWFNRRFRDNPYSMGNCVEETPTHTYLASGMAGSCIWAIEIDSLGNELRRQTFYETPTQAVMDETSAVQQTPNGGYVVSGNPINFTPDFYYLGYHNAFSSSSQVWGGEVTQAEILTPRVQLDGSILFYNYHGGNGFLSRIGYDSTSVWDVQFRSQISNIDYPRLAAVAYVGDTTAIGVGTMHETGTGSPSDQFYLCRIRNVGLPYHAVEPVATAVCSKGSSSLSTYPNPTVGTLIVHSKGREPLSLFDLSGKKVLATLPNPSGTTRIDLTPLPPGIYQLRQGPTTIRVIKQ